ncbi:DNA polymerase III subunit alpha [Leuconostoc gelidum subsp. gelidum]|uniref:DNA polymerase III subunit alpha n=1 Tax=Leuconostoc gelidum subsp. gelidum TaxID=1607839 RepID=A0AB35G178_LEUGE|nr:DNA polymerase III subunit alpha [Leuconostoc gelidum]MBZ5963667.1 DNA polymerase III subunit alpha [Leuconostoc gelidum subsp. gelidum]MBZ5975490.1 DNA polymerase III subunit alpha [Leuconostoc gelidum subsp. gelidum]MBZ5976339.1 DNA polymerase III subunit alpha [Leuconostoc gelidum subsp. gelidum]MBZ5987124.1 DNA polymerase III subunit alpha [Leuconostoc gelidum subsp. gelidum]MBZ6000321.1 DNA polymerase III subunit alpha [Leuconostoc gelidum subsp. gelidum]
MYAPLQILSAYSLLKNPNTIEQIIETAKKRHYQAIALTDINVMYGAVKFYQVAKENNIKPLFGVTLQVNGLINTATVFPIVLIAENQTGYQNLMWISSAKMTTKVSEMTLDVITGHLAGINVIFPNDSEISQFIASEYTQSVDYWQQLSTKIDPKKLYLGINPQLAPQIQERLVTFSEKNQAKLIALDTVDYLNSDDAFTTQVLKAIETNTKLDDIKLLAQQVGTHVLQDFNEVQIAYLANDALKTAYLNNELLVSKSHVEIIFKQTATLPKFHLPNENQTSENYLRYIAEKGLLERINGRQVALDQYEKRLQHELQIINNLAFNDYFLIVWDIVNFAHQKNIQMGAGRGSAAGSLVAYALRITDVDPIQFGLLFERFLNPQRIQMPDIDIDWPDNKRDLILNYLHDKYGQRNFAQILTFGTLAAKQALRDTARVFGLSQQMMSRISNAVPQGKQGRKVLIQDTLNESNVLRTVLSDVDNGDLLLKVAQHIEGLPRNYSTHAAGVVLSSESLIKTLPVQSGSDDRLLTQFEKNPVEALGLLKIDILGLSNLSILAQTLYDAKKQLPDHFDISKIPLDDSKTLALYAKGDTNGVFQFESSGIKNVLRQLKPTTFEHIVAVNALYRPGPSRNIQAFIQRRHGREKVTILDSSLKTILAPTFGIIVYQEQVMLVAETFAGFTLGEADLLRSAMSKKKIEKMTAMHEKFVQGAIDLGHDSEQAEQIFAYIDEFANYGFNRSHAVAYSKLSFELAYMKAHYPVAFFTALLNANLGSPEKIRSYIMEAKSRNIEVSPPNINQSQRFWTADDQKLQMGLNNIRGVRTDFVSAVLEERRENGRFKSIQSFIRRLPDKLRKQDTLIQLVYAGALDAFGYNRSELITALTDLIEAAGFGDFILSETKIKKSDDLTLTEKLAHEKEVIGVNLSGHPLDAYSALIISKRFEQIADMIKKDQKIKGIVIIDSVRKTRTKKGEEMAFMTVSDITGTIGITVFSQVLTKTSDLLKAGAMIEITGKVDSYNDKLSIIANQIHHAPDLEPLGKVSGTWFLQFDDEHDTVENRHDVVEILKKNHGDNPVVIYWQNTEQKQTLDAKFWMSDETVIIVELSTLLGYKNVVFRRSQ